MLPESDLLSKVTSLSLISVGGPWTRVSAYRLLQAPPPEAGPGSPPQPLWSGGPRLHGARFNPKGTFGGVYLASDPVTALTEVGAIFDHLGAPRMTLRTPPWVVFAVEGVLTGVLDLTDPEMQTNLGTSVAELTGDWRYTQARHSRGESLLPPTQLLGRVAYDSGAVTALHYHSSRIAGSGTNIVVFPDRLHLNRANFLTVYDPSGYIFQRLP